MFNLSVARAQTFYVSVDGQSVLAHNCPKRRRSHADDRSDERQISQDMIEQALKGQRRRGRGKGVWIYTSGRVRVVKNVKTGKIISVTWRGGGGRKRR